jgi:hypothetical protein
MIEMSEICRIYLTVVDRIFLNISFIQKTFVLFVKQLVKNYVQFSGEFVYLFSKVWSDKPFKK